MSNAGKGPSLKQNKPFVEDEEAAERVTSFCKTYLHLGLKTSPSKRQIIVIRMLKKAI